MQSIEVSRHPELVSRFLGGEGHPELVSRFLGGEGHPELVSGSIIMKHILSMNNELEQLRTIIDTADEHLLQALARRMNAVKKVGAYKKERGIAPLDPSRWHNVLESRIAKGQSLGLSRELIIEIYETIHHHALKIEK